MEDQPFYIVGAGRVAKAFARWLPQAGLTVAGWGARDPQQIPAGASNIRFGSIESIAREVAENGCVLLCVSDNAISHVARFFNPASGIVIHTSGLHAASVISHVDESRRLALHPVTSFPENALCVDASPFSGVVCTLEGSPRARDLGAWLVARLGGASLPVSPAQKEVLHAASTLLANMTVVLASTFDALTAGSGIPNEAADRIRHVLLDSVTKNIEAVGPTRALTGPIRRGDAATVAAHLETLKGVAPAYVEVYRTLSLKALDIVRSQLDIPSDTLNDLDRLLN